MNTTSRQLYRGALSLPDSNLLLDGLTFTIQLPSDDPQASRLLLETPLPLDLESMRGRPSLSFVGVVKLDELYCDFEEKISLHVHPRCILTKQLFAHNLCVDPITSPHGRTELGIRIRLGESNASPNDIVVYGQPHPSSSTMNLHVARIVPAPVSAAPPKKAVAKPKPPRPDDPIPRKPPAGYVGIARIGLGMKRTASTASIGLANGLDEPQADAKKKVKKDKDPPNASVQSKGNDGMFKVPSLPPTKAKAKSTASTPDAFEVNSEENEGQTSDLESTNKMFIKKTVVRLLTAAGIGKQHLEFKEFYSTIYRGVLFALRAKLKSIIIESDQKEVELLDRITQTHVTLYLGGKGMGIHLLQ